MDKKLILYLFKIKEIIHGQNGENSVHFFQSVVKISLQTKVSVHYRLCMASELWVRNQVKDVQALYWALRS